jgi:CRP-like cAMP-binding protein
MTNDSILKNVAKHISLNKEETDHFLSMLTYKDVARKTILLKEGQPCHYLNFVHSGALRAYHLDKDAKESTIMFAINDWWVTDMYCFVNEKPAMMYIEAIEDSSIYQLSKTNMAKLFHDIAKFERFFRILMQNAYTREQLRVIENLSLSADERYESFLKKYPHIAQAVTQKQIASYLGITPEFLSALRKEKTIRRIS